MAASESPKNSSSQWMTDIRPMLQAHFAQMAPVYSDFGPHWCALAKEMLEWSPVPIDSKSIIHDNGCGTGQVSTEVLQLSKTLATNPQIYATDWSEAMIEQLHKLHPSMPVKSIVVDSEDLSAKFNDDFFTHSIASLVLMVAADPAKIVREMYRTLKPGSVALASTWATQGGSEIVDQALHRVWPEAPTFTGPRAPPERLTVEWLKALFTDAGFAEERIMIHRTVAKVLCGGWNDAAREVFCEAMAKQVVMQWPEADKEGLQDELVRSFNPAKGGAESFEHEAWVLVAVK